ncbi:hypothetical protein HID58_055391 [Brassica napus]|uniref:Uncharacterized protein n=1 Tax=Brassica napus TaxID=3708 RepID=A0ABQ8AKD2_BRANA|nr:hypothetical protein HID58_055391 [Brassica napus]
MFERVPFQQVLQMNTDNTYPIDLFGRVTTLETLIQSLDDPYEDIFGFMCMCTNNIIRWNAKFKNSLPEIWIRNWPLSKYHPTFLALRFWRVNYNDQGKVMITDGGQCAKFKFDPTWIQ